jgi:hypothetical protein
MIQIPIGYDDETMMNGNRVAKGLNLGLFMHVWAFDDDRKK